MQAAEPTFRARLEHQLTVMDAVLPPATHDHEADVDGYLSSPRGQTVLQALAQELLQLQEKTNTPMRGGSMGR
jgi:hypothetical protein